MKRILTALFLFAAPSFAGERLLVTDVRLAEDPDAPRVSLLLEHGRITEIIIDREASLPGVRSYSGEGRWLAPSFIDAWTSSGVVAPEIVTDRDRKPDVSAEIMPEMRAANRKGIRAGFSVASSLSFEGEELSGMREGGFGTLHVAPGGELLGGKSAVVSTSEAAARDQVIAVDIYQCAAFRASGTGYPSTLMGYHAQLRQFFLDARWVSELRRRWEEGRPGPRPAFDVDLREGEAILTGGRTLLCEADSDDDILRWLRLADEWGVEIAIVGGREAWRVADVLREREIPVFLTLDWGDEVEDPDEDEDEGEGEESSEGEGDEPDSTEDQISEGEVTDEPDDEEAPAESTEDDSSDEETSEESSEEEISWEYTEPLGVRREKRARWEEGRDCAIRLHEAGVLFAFGSGTSTSKKMIEKVRTLVEEGLPSEVALAGLTDGAASLLGLEGRVGVVEPGAVANLCVWAGDPLGKKPRLAATIVDGVIHEFDLEAEEDREAPDEEVEIDGAWKFEYSSSEAGTTSMKLEMNEDGDVTGELTVQNRHMDEPQTDEITGQVSGNVLSLSARIDIEGFVVEIEFEGEVSEDAYEGNATWIFSGGSQESDFTATRAPEQEEEVQR